MDILGEINSREIVYVKHRLDFNWANELPDSNWLFLGLVDIESNTILDEIARKIIDKNVCYACCFGHYGEKLHDLIDETLSIREVEIENNYLPPFNIMTTWHKYLDECIWFASYLAFHEEVDIKTIFCLDIGNDSHKEKIIELVKRLNNGFIPENE